MTVLFNRNDVYNPRLFYPSETVVAGTRWSSGFKPKKSAASSPVKWATLTILTPPMNGKKDNKVTSEEESHYLKTLNAKAPTDDEILARHESTSSPSDAEKKLSEILDHLARRGCIWTRAGQKTRASLRNPDPKTRPEYLVQGVFPEVRETRSELAYFTLCVLNPIPTYLPSPPNRHSWLAANATK
jgi:hypothetical protein